MSRRDVGNARQRGFTLIEVLVALAIVAIGMAAVLGTLTSSASTVLYLHDKTIAQWVALNHIAETRLTGNQPGIGNTDGDVDYAGQKWHWRQETVATAVQGMVRMDVMVRPADAPGDNDKGWYVTLSGIMGDAVGAPRGDLPLWDTGAPGASSGGASSGGASSGGASSGGASSGGASSGGASSGGTSSGGTSSGGTSSGGTSSGGTGSGGTSSGTHQ